VCRSFCASMFCLSGARAPVFWLHPSKMFLRAHKAALLLLLLLPSPPPPFTD
jgi:hypothetical protein